MTVTFETRPSLLDSDAVDQAHGSAVTRDGHKLHAYRWSSRNAENSGAAVLVVNHGYGEHCGRYDELARYLVAAGHPVYGFDARGHGRSPGQRGHIRRHDLFIDDMHRFLVEVRTRYPSRPLVLLGHSHGGLISIRTLQTRKPLPDGLILCSPMIALQRKYKPIPLWLADIGSRLLPRLPLPSGIDAADLTHDAALVDANKRDPLGHTRTTPRWFAEAGHAMRRATKNLEALSLPTLLLIAEQDRLVVPAELERLFTRIPSADKEVVRYPEAFHEIFNEVGRQQTYQRVASWIAARFGAAVAA
jgi:alpha-beta hydrolase superfamily lysophospholipase